jgi:hypothetical protein
MNRKSLKTTEEKGADSAKSESTVEHKSRIATTGRKNENASKPVSLAPLSFEDAISAILKIRKPPRG